MSAAAHTPPLSREEIIRVTATPIPRAITLICAALAVLGGIVFVIGAIGHNPRAWQALHVAWLYFTSISAAAGAFVAVQRITTARWSRPIVRMLEGFVAFLPVAWVLLVLILLFGNHSIFPWTHHEIAMPERRAYLNLAFLIPRDLILFGIMVGVMLAYVYSSLRLDMGIVPEAGANWARGLRDRMRRGFGEERREIHSTHSRQGTLAVIVVLCFGFFMSVLAIDLSMAVDEHFFSTLYPWWFFMGGWIGMLMSWSLIVMAWRRYLGAYDLITESHIHDLGKLCFAFSAFWGYLTFGQYLIIWYANVGEETHWFRLRLMAPWLPITMSVVFLMFVFPFFGLLSRAAKLYLPTFIIFALSSLIGLWLLRYIEVYPPTYGSFDRTPTLPFGLWEVAIFAGVLGLWGLCYTSFMNAFPRMRVMLMTSPYRDQVQVPYDPETMEPLPAHE